MNIFRFQHDTVVPGFSHLCSLALSPSLSLWFFYTVAPCTYELRKAHTLILPNARSLREHLQSKCLVSEKKKKIHYAPNQKFSAFFLLRVPFCISRTHSEQFLLRTHRSNINLFHFDFNRFMRKSFTLPMFKILLFVFALWLHTATRAFTRRRIGNRCFCTLRQILLDILYMRI